MSYFINSGQKGAAIEAKRVLIVDDHDIVRQGLRAILESEPYLQIVGEASDGLEAVGLVERLQPHVLVLDLMIPGLNGFEVTRQVRKRSPHTHVVILSMYSDEAYVLEALRAGAEAYVLKESPSDELVRAIREATAGRHYLSPPLSEHAIAAYVKKAEATIVDPYETLTSRERQVLYLAASGHTNAKIAAMLVISTRTVETHRAHVMRKLGLRTQGDLIRYALERQLVPKEDRSHTANQ